MGPFLTGFCDELLKLGAIPQSEVPAGPYDTATPASQTVEQYLGAGAKVGLKGGPKVFPPPPPYKIAPTPMTAANETTGRTES